MYSHLRYLALLYMTLYPNVIIIYVALPLINY